MKLSRRDIGALGVLGFILVVTAGMVGGGALAASDHDSGVGAPGEGGLLRVDGERTPQ
jgi:hypothetical protein